MPLRNRRRLQLLELHQRRLELALPKLNFVANVASPSRAAQNSVQNEESLRCSATANHERTRMGCRSLRMLVAVPAGHGCLGRSIQQHHPGDEASTRWRNAMASVSRYGRDYRTLSSRGVAPRVSHLSLARLALPQSFLLRAARRVGFRNCSAATL